MEKIHSAIQKARKERDAKLARDASARPLAEAGAPPGATLQLSSPSPQSQVAMTAPDSAPAAPPPDATPAELDAERLASWAALTQYKFDPSALSRNRIVSHDSGNEAACYDVLRTNILRQMRANGWKRLAITSPTPGCGKTTTSLNLGFSLGRLHDLHTMVIEADLRRPAMRVCLRLKPRHMFASFLSGDGSAQDNLAACGAGLAFGTNHGPTRNSAELLASKGVGDRLAEIDRLYAPDITIFDMTPMLVSDDAIAFLPNVDCTLLVAAAGVTTTAQIDRCERALAEQTNVLGVVLNKARYMAPDENYGYDYY